MPKISDFPTVTATQSADYIPIARGNTNVKADINALILAIVNGSVQFNLPDEANGDPIPAPGSKLPYLSAGVLKIA